MVPLREGAGIQLALLSGTPRHAPRMSLDNKGQVRIIKIWKTAFQLGHRLPIGDFVDVIWVHVRDLAGHLSTFVKP